MSRRKHRGNGPRPSNPAPFANVDAPECAPSYSLDGGVNRARLEMGEARWAELNQEWNEVVPPEVIKARNEAAWQRAIGGKA